MRISDGGGSTATTPPPQPKPTPAAVQTTPNAPSAAPAPQTTATVAAPTVGVPTPSPTPQAAPSPPMTVDTITTSGSNGPPAPSLRDAANFPQLTKSFPPEQPSQPPPSSAIKDARDHAADKDFGTDIPTGINGASQLAYYVADGKTATDRANRLNAVKNELGNDPTGQRAFLQTLQEAQIEGPESKADGGPDVAANVKSAFQTMVQRGDVSASDVRGLVDQQRQTAEGAPLVQPGEAYTPEDSSKYDGLGDYFKNMPTDNANVNAAQNAFVDESLRQGSATKDGNVRDALYGQAAETLGSMQSGDIQQTLGKLGTNGLPTMQDFVNGALNGEADRYRSDKLLDSGTPSENGVASMLNTLTGDAAHAQSIDGPNAADAASQKTTTDLFNAAMQYFSANPTSDSTKALLANDSSDGLRAAFNGAISSDFNGILQSNTNSSGNSLTQQGMQNFAAYSRLEFGNDAKDQNAQNAQADLGVAIGKLYGTTLAAQNGDPSQLAANFGNIFKDDEGNTAAQSASTVLGQVLGSTLSGMAMDYQSRQSDAETSKDGAIQGYTNLGNLLTFASVAAAPFSAGASIALGAGAGAALSKAANPSDSDVPKNEAYGTFLQGILGSFTGTGPNGSTEAPGSYLGGTDGTNVENGVTDAFTFFQIAQGD